MKKNFNIDLEQIGYFLYMESQELQQEEKLEDSPAEAFQIPKEEEFNVWLFLLLLAWSATLKIKQGKQYKSSRIIPPGIRSTITAAAPGTSRSLLLRC